MTLIRWRVAIENRGAVAVIPPKRNRLIQRNYNLHLYKQRNVVESFFNRIKQFLRIATCFKKLARNYFALLNLVCAYIRLL